MITEKNVIESIKDSVNLADVNPENFESTVQFIHRQYEIVLKAKEKEIEKCYQEISHLRKMVESLAKEPIIINLENKNIEEEHSAPLSRGRLSREIEEIFNNNHENILKENIPSKKISDIVKNLKKEMTEHGLASKNLDLVKNLKKEMTEHGLASKNLDLLRNNADILNRLKREDKVIITPIEGVDSKQKVPSQKNTPKSNKKQLKDHN
jgi:hypothetical protein